MPTRAYSVTLGGFDTHVGEKAPHQTLLQTLDAGLDGFLTRVAAGPNGQGVVVAVYSEFGRRLAENAGDGTDHGEAGPVLLLGPSVHGGLYGEEPSLTRLDGGDITYTVDFRDVYATLLTRVLGADPGPVLPGWKPTLLTAV